MNSHKYVAFLIRLALVGALCAPSAPLFAQGKFLNPGSAQKDNSAADTQAPPEKPTTPDGEQGPTGQVTLEQVTNELDRLQKLEGDNAPKDKDKLVDYLNQAKSFLQQEQQYRDDGAKLQVDPKAIADDVAAKKKELEESLPAPEEVAKEFAFPSDATPILKQIQEKLAAATPRLADVKQKKLENENDLKDVESRIASREDRQKKIPGELAELDKRLEEVNKSLQAKPAEDEAQAVTLARQAALRTEQQMLLEKRKYLTKEGPYYESRKELRSLERQVLQERIRYQNGLIDALQTQVLELEKLETRAQEEQARDIVKEAPEALKPLAEEVASLIKFKGSPEGPLALTIPLHEKLTVTKELLDKLKKQRESTEKRLSAASRPQTLAPILDYQRSLLPSIYQYEEGEIDHHRKSMEYRSNELKYNERSEELKEKKDELKNGLLEGFSDAARSRVVNGKALNDLMKSLSEGETSPAVNGETVEKLTVEKYAQELLNAKQKVLEQLENSYEQLSTESEGLATIEGDLVVFVQKYDDYLDEQSLWVPMAEVLQVRDFQNIKEGFAPLLEPANWQLLAQTLKTEILNSPVWSGVIVILVLAFFPVQIRLKRRLFQLSDEFSDSFLAPFALTKKAFFITLLLPLWIPALLWLVGYRLLRVVPDTSVPAANPAFVPGFGRALVVVAFTLCVLRLLRYLVKPNGLGEVHFRWPKQQLAKVRLHLHLFTVCVVPLLFLIVMIYHAGTSEERRSVGRILMVALLLLSSWFLYRVLAPTRSKDERTSSVKLSFGKRILIYGPCCVPLFFALLSISGYTYTAAVLMFRLILSSGILLLLVMLNELAYRWVYIARGKLALEQARQRQEAREAEQTAKAEGGASDAPRVFDPKSSGVDLSAINTQTRKLLTTSFGLAVFISMWWVWSGVTPQLAFLNRPVFAIAQTSSDEGNKAAEESAESSGSTGNNEETKSSTDNNTETVSKPVTYGDLLLFILTIVVTLIASRNLPGLLEISVLQSLPLDTGIRYAAGTIARYIVMTVGIVVSCQFIHIGMTQISIMVGGLAVGLGFGLQEMFANFISGIILLFEQPLRVGDIVTVGDVTGTVTRIRIRATTITDWDRKEFIIPNKELITGQFNNWTLSDTINRLVILVGIAYGADTDRARSLLLKVCADHPEVLDDPAPSAIFDAFGNSALNLTLRCYLPKLDNRLQTIHELHTAIDREFKKAGLEIAFPQMDLHLRSIDQIKNPIPLAQEVPEAERAYPQS